MGFVSRYINREQSIVFNHIAIDVPQDVNFRMHVHDVCEMIYLVSGDISAIIGEKTYKLPKNSVVFFRANVPHRIRIDSSDEPYERYDIIFDENLLANRIFFEIPHSIDVINYTGERRITDLLKRLDYYPQHFDGKNLQMLITGVVEELLFNLYLMPADTIDETLLTVHPLIGDAVTYINAHYAEPITVEDICRQLNITKSYLHRLFVEEMSISPKKYVNVRRLAKAQRLIRRGGRPSHIYAECGFAEYATFFRNYTEYFGYPPSQENHVEIERKIKS